MKINGDRIRAGDEPGAVLHVCRHRVRKPSWIAIGCCLMVSWSAVWGASDRALPEMVIFETDMAGDCDDVGALAMLHGLMDRGEVTLLMVGVNREEPKRASAAAVDVINTYYGRPNLPIGTYQGGDTQAVKESPYASVLRDEFPHDCPPDDQCPRAVPLYRKTLAGVEDQRVTLISVGGFSNLAALLDSGPDAFSPLSGRDLVAAKVKQLVAMAGAFPSSRKPETNMSIHPAASIRMAHDWPTPIVWCGLEVGQTVITGTPLQATPPDNPVRRAYEKHMNGGRTSLARGRASYDQCAVLFGVRGPEALWTLIPGRIRFTNEQADNTWSAARTGRQAYLVKSVPDAQLARDINQLMVRQSGN